MIGEVAAFTIDDLVKELRCMAARDMGSDEWKKCMELHEKFLDDVCQRCEYHHDGSPCGYDPGNPYDLCSLAAYEIEMLRGRTELAEAKLKAAEKDIRKLLLLLMHLARRGAKSATLACNYCAECDLLKCAADCKGHARWRGITEPDEQDEWERSELEDE